MQLMLDYIGSIIIGAALMMIILNANEMVSAVVFLIKSHLFPRSRALGGKVSLMNGRNPCLTLPFAGSAVVC